MKKTSYILLVLFALCLLSFNLSAQKPFEGIITYEVKIEGEGAEAYQSFMPNEFKYYFKNLSVKLVMSGGFSAMLGEYIIDGEKGMSYLVKHDEQSYSILKDESPSKEAVTSNFLGETTSINGYECKKYESVSTDANGEKTTSILWTTDKIIIKLPKSKSMNSSGLRQ